MPRHPPCALSNLTTLTTKKICLDARVHCAVLKVRAVHVRESSCAVTSTVVRGRTCPGRRELTATRRAGTKLDGPKVRHWRAPQRHVMWCGGARLGPNPQDPTACQMSSRLSKFHTTGKPDVVLTRERVRHPLSDVPPMSNLGGTYAHSKGSGRHYRNSPINDARCSLERR